MNWKKDFLFFFIILIEISLSAQPNEKKGYVGIVFGPSFPVGNFANNTLNEENAGFAKVDYSISDITIDFGYRFGKNLGLSVSYLASSFDIDSSDIGLVMSISGIKAGPMFSLPIADKFFFDMTINFGYIFSSLIFDDPKYEENLGNGLLIGLGATFRYNIFKRWCLLAESGYLLSNQKFDDVLNSKIQTINLGLGIAYRL